MADTTTPPPPIGSAPAAELALAAPDERGTLEVRTKAIQHIVEQAVLQTPGTVAHRGALGKLVGSGSPKANVTMEGRRARVVIDVAAVWPCEVSRIATDVRDRVLSEATRISGVLIRTVDVTIHLVEPGEATNDQNERRVQ